MCLEGKREKRKSYRNLSERRKTVTLLVHISGNESLALPQTHQKPSEKCFKSYFLIEFFDAPCWLIAFLLLLRSVVPFDRIDEREKNCYDPFDIWTSNRSSNSFCKLLWWTLIFRLFFSVSPVTKFQPTFFFCCFWQKMHIFSQWLSLAASEMACCVKFVWNQKIVHKSIAKSSNAKTYTNPK